MSPDPRLRLLGNDQEYDGADILHALDQTSIVIRTGSDMTGTRTGALAALVAMTARLFGNVVLDPPVTLAPNWWNAATTDDLMSALDAVRPHPTRPPTRTLVVTIGDRVPAGTLGIGGGDYSVRIGRHPQPLDEGPSTHSLGVHAAACLAVSQLLLTVLGPHGFSGVAVEEPYTTNLIDHAVTEPPLTVISSPTQPRVPPLQLAVAGVGSVGTSSIALVATALSPVLAGAVDSPLQITLVDADTIDPARNPFRYPALLGNETGYKTDLFAHHLSLLGVPARSVPSTVADWVRSRDRPGFDGLILSSVDTIGGRLDVADALARSTLSVGVSGLALHVQREGFADGWACPFCDYVSAAPPTTQAGVHAVTTGLSVPRVLTLLQDGERLAAADVDVAVAAGKLPGSRRSALIGATINDLVRQVYAEAALCPSPQIESRDQLVAVAAPQVSWFAGVLAAAEIVKQVRGLPLLDRRVDVDLSGLPPGLVRRVAADRSGLCLCRSGTRIRWHRKLYGDLVPTCAALPSVG